MKNIKGRLVRFLFFLPFLIFVPGSFLYPPYFHAFFIGFLIYLPLWVIVRTIIDRYLYGGHWILRSIGKLIAIIFIQIVMFYISVYAWMVFDRSESAFAMKIKNHRALKREQEHGLVPANATDIYIQDNHGGFHGDGLTFLTFTCVSQEPNIPIKPNWEKPPLFEKAQSTFDFVINCFSVPAHYLPDMSSPSVYYMINDRGGGEFHVGHLYIHDKEKDQYWYFNVSM